MKRRTKKLGKLEKIFWGENIPVGDDKVQNQVDWGLKKELWATVWVRLKVKVKATQSCLALCNSMNYTVLGILQARILECVAVPFSRGSSQPRDQIQSPALRVDSLPSELPGNPSATWEAWNLPLELITFCIDRSLICMPYRKCHKIPNFDPNAVTGWALWNALL